MWVLNKRIIRNIKANASRWCAIFFLVVLCLYLVISLFGKAVQIYYNHDNFMNDYHVADGSFKTFAKLSETELENAEAKGFTIEATFYADFEVSSDAKLRLFRNREKMNLLCAVDGAAPEKDDELFLEQNYAQAHELTTGDSIEIAGKTFTICGIGCSPDYEQVYETSTSVADRNHFGTAFVTEKSYEELIATGKTVQAETFQYCFKKNDSTTEASVLEDYLRDIEFDESRVDDPFFIEMLDRVLESKNDLKRAVQDLTDVSDDLSEYSADLDDGAGEMEKASQEFYDAADEMSSGIKELYNGAKELVDHSDELKDGAKQTFEALLTNAENQLADNGITVDLTIENYDNTLRHVNTSSLSDAAAERISYLRSSLDQMNTFYQGVVSYTDGVNSAAQSTAELNDAMSQLSGSANQLGQSIASAAAMPELTQYLSMISTGYSALNGGIQQVAEGERQLQGGLQTLSSRSSELVSGADQIRNVILSTASDQLRAAGIQVDLNADNYAGQLNSLEDSLLQQSDDAVYSSISSLINALNNYRKFYDGINTYTDGVQELYDGIETLYNARERMISSAEEMNDSAKELTDYTKQLKDGADELNTSVHDFSDSVDELDDIFKLDIDNLTSFTERNDKTRIVKSANSAVKSGAMCGLVSLMILSYILSVFVVHEVDNESTVIGAFYAMGVSRHSLMRHYIAVPVLITLCGGICGTLLGLSKYGTDLQLNESLFYNSLPPIQKTLNLTVLAAGILTPPLIATVVTFLVIRSRLRRSPLSLLRRERSVRSVSNVKTEKLSFVAAFRLKQILNEVVTSCIVFIGLLLPLLLLILSMNFLVSRNTFLSTIGDDIKLHSMYMMKYEPKEPPENSEVCYMESFTMNSYGTDVNVTLMGIERESECFHFQLHNAVNTVAVGSGTALKFHLSEGDVIQLKASQENRYYTFVVDEIVDYSVGLYVFMDINDMRSFFGKSDDYYNTLISLEPLDIEKGRLYATLTREDMVKTGKNVMSSLSFLVYVLIFVSVMVFIIITYLMIKLMIDRAALNISLFKIFGFDAKEIQKLYLDENFYIICASSLIGIPLAKIMVDRLWFPVMTANVVLGLNIEYPIWLYGIIFVAVLILYFMVSFVLKKKISAIPMTEVLKNRE